MLLAGLVVGCMTDRQACMLLLLNRALPGLALRVLEEAPILEGDVPSSVPSGTPWICILDQGQWTPGQCPTGGDPLQYPRNSCRDVKPSISAAVLTGHHLCS